MSEDDAVMKSVKESLSGVEKSVPLPDYDSEILISDKAS